MSKSAAIFDLDGVLLLSGPVHEAAYRRALKGAGLGDFDYAELAGRRTDEAIRMLAARAGRRLSEPELEGLVREKRRLAAEALEREAPVAPGAPEVLRRLAGRLRLAVATSGSRGSLELFLERSGTRPLFSALLSGEEVARSKPDPEIYRTCLRLLEARAAEAVVVEDSEAGVRAALAAGIEVIALADGARGEALARAGAARVLGRLEDLVEVLAP